MAAISATAIGQMKFADETGASVSGSNLAESVQQTQQDVTEPTEIQSQLQVNINDTTGTLTQQQKDVLAQYAEIYMNTLIKLESGDISGLYSDTENERYQLNNTALQVITTVRNMSHKDLKLERASITYNVQESYLSKGRTVVNILEDNTQKFKFLEDVSQNFIIRHQFVLEEVDGKCYIYSHEQDEDFYLLTAEAWEKYSGTPEEISQKVMNHIIADTQENLVWREENYLDKTYPKTASDTSYNRDAAVEYAVNWVGKRNYTGQYLAYDDYGGNCQNFASQCLFAGGLAMDYKGTSTCHWKFYSQTLNETSTARGRSYSWTGVDPFYSYCYYNTDTGIIAETEWGTAYTQKGDIIQVGAMAQWRHSLVVTDVEYDENGYATEIIVASNTADRLNYPLSAYIYTAPRLIHIVGQNV